MRWQAASLKPSARLKRPHAVRQRPAAGDEDEGRAATGEGDEQRRQALVTEEAAAELDDLRQGLDLRHGFTSVRPQATPNAGPRKPPQAAVNSA